MRPAFRAVRNVYFAPIEISCASSEPLLLSKVTTITPSAGVFAASALLTEMTTLVVSVAPGATASAKPPSLIALPQGLYFARPGTALLPPLTTSKLTMRYVSLGFVAERQNFVLRQS